MGVMFFPLFEAFNEQWSEIIHSCLQTKLSSLKETISSVSKLQPFHVPSLADLPTPIPYWVNQMLSACVSHTGIIMLFSKKKKKKNSWHNLTPFLCMRVLGRNNTSEFQQWTILQDFLLSDFFHTNFPLAPFLQRLWLKSCLKNFHSCNRPQDHYKLEAFQSVPINQEAIRMLWNSLLSFLITSV